MQHSRLLSRITAAGCLVASAGGVSAGIGSADILYVDPDATGANDGTSWNDALVDLQTALLLAWIDPLIEEVRIAEGTYYPGPPGSSSELSFLVPPIEIRGGYAGVGTADPDAFDPLTYRTILSGDIGRDDNSGSFDDNAGPVVTVPLDDPVRITGIVIRDGYSDEAFVPGGIWFPVGQRDAGGPGASGPTLSRCEFENNRAPQGGAIGYGYPLLTDPDEVAHDGVLWIDQSSFSGNVAYEGFGGAIFYQPGRPQSLTIENSSFVGNRAESTGDTGNAELGGGAIYASSIRRTSSDNDLQFATTIRGCDFTENTAAGDAGARVSGGAILYLSTDVFALDPDTLAIAGCRFVGNDATAGGDPELGSAIRVKGRSSTQHETSVTLSFSEFRDNAGRFTVYLDPTSSSNQGPVPTVIEACRFNENRSTALLVRATQNVRIDRCAFIGNRSATGPAALRLSLESRVTGFIPPETRVVNTLFLGNRSENADGDAYAAALVNLNARDQFYDLRFINCSFVGNESVAPNGMTFGGGMWLIGRASDDPGPLLQSCLLWDNAENGITAARAQLLVDTDPPYQPEFTRTIFENLPSGTPGSANSAADPRLLDLVGPDGVARTGDEDARPGPRSPAIDAGDNGLLPPGTLIDAGNQLRFVDAPYTPDRGVGSGPIVDIGALEAVPTPCAIDLTRDFALDSDDFFALLDAIQSQDLAADLDDDGDVDAEDFFLFLDLFETGCI